MSLQFSSIIFALAGEGGMPWYLNVPGFEAWRWFNLLLFVGVLYLLSHRWLAKIFNERRATIRHDLMRAQEERDAALKKLDEVNARLQTLDGEVAKVREQAQAESNVERERIAQETKRETERLREQAEREIASIAKAAQQELREFTATQSVALAEQMIRQEMRPETDARLIKDYVADLGGARR